MDPEKKANERKGKKKIPMKEKRKEIHLQNRKVTEETIRLKLSEMTKVHAEFLAHRRREQENVSIC